VSPSHKPRNHSDRNPRVAHMAARIDRGGAAAIARTLHNAAPAHGWSSQLWYASGPRGLGLPDPPAESQRIQTTARVLANHGLHRVLGLDPIAPTIHRRGATFNEDPPDLLHVHYLHSHIGSLSSLQRYANAHKIPVVWTLHDLWLLTGRCATPHASSCDRYLYGCGRCPDRGAYPSTLVDTSRLVHASRRRALERFANSILLVAPTRVVASTAESAGLGVRIEIIHNSVGRHFIEQPLPSSREIDSTIRVAVAATDLSDPIKVPPKFVEWLSRQDGLEIGLIGKNPPSSLPANVTAHGFVPQPERLAEIFRSHDVLFFPATHETFGLLAAEALCSGCHVVATHSEVIAEVLSLVGGRTVATLDEALKMIRDRTWPILYNQAGRRQLAEKAKKIFDSSIMTQRYHQLYSDILQSCQ
jgi:putative colanic acid biosynthesis glycosyltransferase